MILLCYDGSADAQTAIEHAAKLLDDKSATVLTVWEPFIQVMARTGAGMALADPTLNTQEIDAASQSAAREAAEEGAERARQAGLTAEPRTVSRGGTIADTILTEADAVDADVIVLGTRGLTGLKSLFLGSVSHAVLQNADRPVVVVPSQEVAAKRAERRA